MNIVSYRGPGMAGGVSAALARAWDANPDASHKWWHLDKSDLHLSLGTDSQGEFVASFPEHLLKQHYHYCNDFLWPVMHDLPQYAIYKPEDRQQYVIFNRLFSWWLSRKQSVGGAYFIQDYQLALIPQYIKENSSLRSVLFWHIPWPKNVSPEFIEPIAELARGMLGAETVGFHTQEYANNFVAFVRDYLPDFDIDSDSQISLRSRRRAKQAERQQLNPRHAQQLATQVVVFPLGIDVDHWSNLAARQDNTIWHPSLVKTPFVLSVDRADYTKGVVDRIQAIDIFFDENPEWREEIVFAQVCGKTRPGLESFDGYWQECRELAQRLKNKWATPNWQPLVWIESSFSPAELALAYRTASMMIVNPVRDGLNLTAKEYVACQGNRPGVLALSTGAGAWNELSSHALPLEPHAPRQIANAIHDGLTMEGDERAWRVANLKARLRQNTLHHWWNYFVDLVDIDHKTTASMPILKETS